MLEVDLADSLTNERLWDTLVDGLGLKSGGKPLHSKRVVGGFAAKGQMKGAEGLVRSSRTVVV